VISNFTNGVALIAAQLANRSWVLAFSGPSWNLTQGETIPIDLTLDGQAQFRVFGAAKNSKLLSAPLPEVAVSRLRKSQLLVASGLSPAAPAPAPAGPVQLTPPSGKVFQFHLGALNKAMYLVTNCVEKVKAKGPESAGDFSLDALKSPTVASTSKSNEAAAKPNEVEPTAPSERSAKLVNSNGTGFIISANGHVLTNNHVISGCIGDIQGNLAGEPATTLRVVSQDETNDLALLQATGILQRTGPHTRDCHPFGGRSNCYRAIPITACSPRNRCGRSRQ
jgi:hypothetical protein